MIRGRVPFLFLLFPLLAPGIAWSQEASAPGGAAPAPNPWPFCPADLGVPPRPVVTEKLEPGDIQILADHAELTEGGISHLEGNVQVTRDDRQVQADEAFYNQAADNADAVGDVNYWDDGIYMHGDKVHLEFGAGTGTAENVDYRVLSNRGRGQAKEMFMDPGNITRGRDIDYSTCEPEAPGTDFSSNTWKLSATELTLNHETERGYAHNVVFRIKDVPVFYFPYMTFPLSDRRKSGFLIPSVGSTSTHGFEMRTPLYWNISPQMDATFTPRVLSSSGVMAMGEFRYLFETGQGQFNGEYLPSDNKYDDRDRAFVSFQHDQRFLRHGHLNLNYNYASDKRYLEDFGSQLSLTSTRYLERRADVSYLGSWWSLLGRVQDYQTIDDSIPVAARPYQRLPQIRLSVYPMIGNNRFNFRTDMKFDYLDRDTGNVLPDVHGARFDIYPSISYPYRTRSAFITPRLGVEFTQYDLAASGPFKTSPSRALPIASVDSGVFLERNFDLGSHEYLQTFEPRLFYLYVPRTDQTDLPVFDTSAFNISYDSLFRTDRFSGPDRVGDANQFTLAFTSRLIDEHTGGELGYVRLAQTYNMSDQDVLIQRLNANGTLTTVGQPYTDTLGPVVAEVGVRVFDDWSLRGEFHWVPQSNTTEELALRAAYRPGNGRVLNLSYRVRRTPVGDPVLNNVDIEQTDVSFRWPINPQWAVVGRWNYAVPEAKSIDLFGGVEYESCCFGVRAVARRFLNNLRGDYSTGIFLQVELKGLTGIGKRTEEFLTQKIPGYEAQF